MDDDFNEVPELRPSRYNWTTPGLLTEPDSVGVLGKRRSRRSHDFRPEQLQAMYPPPKQPRPITPEEAQLYVIEAILNSDSPNRLQVAKEFKEIVSQTPDITMQEVLALSPVTIEQITQLSPSYSRLERFHQNPFRTSPISPFSSPSSSSSFSYTPESVKPTKLFQEEEEHVDTSDRDISHHPLKGVSDSFSKDLITRNFFSSYLDLNYVDLHKTDQDYAPGVYDGQIVRSFISSIVPGTTHTTRISNTISPVRFQMQLQIVLPEQKVNEVEAALLNDEIRIIVAIDYNPLPNPPSVKDVLSVHDTKHTINAFVNPVNANRFRILHDASYFLQYNQLWEFTRGEAEKEARALTVDVKEYIDLDLTGEKCSFSKTTSGYDSLVDYNLFAVFISAKGLKIDHEVLADIKEMRTFLIDWSARFIFK